MDSEVLVRRVPQVLKANMARDPGARLSAKPFNLGVYFGCSVRTTNDHHRLLFLLQMPGATLKCIHNVFQDDSGKL
jgi:hypothetical protein